MVQTSRNGRNEAKRAEILRRAAGVFRRKGFHAAGMREIAKALEMAPGALYYYFESKEDLLYACQILSLKKLLESAHAIETATEPAGRKLERLIGAHLEHVLDDFGGGLAHIEFHVLPDELLAEVVQRRDEYEAIFREVVTEGIASGEFRTTDAKLFALTLLGALNWTVIWWNPTGGRDLDAVASQIAETFLKGLGK